MLANELKERPRLKDTVVVELRLRRVGVDPRQSDRLALQTDFPNRERTLTGAWVAPDPRTPALR